MCREPVTGWNVGKHLVVDRLLDVVGGDIGKGGRIIGVVSVPGGAWLQKGSLRWFSPMRGLLRADVPACHAFPGRDAITRLRVDFMIFSEERNPAVS